jgi:hypothetical protein
MTVVSDIILTKPFIAFVSNAGFASSAGGVVEIELL